MFKKRFTYAKVLHLYCKGLRCVGDIQDSTEHNFFTWEQAQEKFNLTNLEKDDQEDLTNTIVGQWHHLLDTDEDTADARQWLGFYEEGEEDPTFVFRCDTNFTPECLQWHNVTLPLPVQCFMVGTHSLCLREWECPPRGGCMLLS